MANGLDGPEVTDMDVGALGLRGPGSMTRAYGASGSGNGTGNAVSTGGGMAAEQYDEMGQPLHGRSHYNAWDKLGQIWNSGDSAEDKLLQTWRWGNYTVPDAEQRRQEAIKQWGLAPPTEGDRRLEQVEESPLGALGYEAAAVLGGSERAQGLALDAGSAMDGLLMSGSALKSRTPLFMGAQRPPEFPGATSPEIGYLPDVEASMPPVDIGKKGAALEAAAVQHALQRGAVRIFNGKYGSDNGFDVPYFMRERSGDPQIHVDSVKAKNGTVAMRGSGSMTEMGTNNERTRKNAQKRLRMDIEKSPTADDFTRTDRNKLLDQLDRGDVVVNFVGLPSTKFHQGHIDFINNETPYRYGSTFTLDPFKPVKPPPFNLADYGLYLPDAKAAPEKP